MINLKTIPWREVIIQTICALLVILFVYAASSKLMDFARFRVQLGKSPLLTAFAGVIAWTIPAIELAIATLLCIPRARLIGIYASFTLMCLFTLYIGYILRFSPYIPCSCGGILQNMSWNTHLVFNICFVAIAALGVLIHKPSPITALRPKLALP